MRLITIATGVLVMTQLVGCGRHRSGSHGVAKNLWEYNIQTTVDAYDSDGEKSSKWDADARDCLSDFATVVSTNVGADELMGQMRAKLQQLHSVNCTDPLIGYLYTRFIFSESHSDAECAEEYGKVASALEHSDYPDCRKFFGSLWYGRVLTGAGEENDATMAYEKAASHLADALNDKGMPQQVADLYCNELLSVRWWSDPLRWTNYTILEPALSSRWKDTSFALLAKGRAYLTYAWLARGTGMANTVSDAGWKLMEQRLQIAADSLEQAWKLNPNDPRICLEMMQVELGQGKGRERLDLWFDRGMKLDPSNWELCSAKLEYLRPRWYGSIDDMLKFGRECTLNTNYTDYPRLMLAEARVEASTEIYDDKARAEYWKSKAVWADIKFAFEQYFKLFPNDNRYHKNYAKYAFWCGKWQEVLDQVSLMPSTNYQYFGGVGSFNAMVTKAKAEARK